MDFKIVEGDTLKVHWYVAESQNNKSTGAIAFFFGGGWRGGSTPFPKKLRIFFTNSNIVYNTSPIECIKDARSALRFLKQNHSIFNIDPQKINLGWFCRRSHRCCYGHTSFCQ